VALLVAHACEDAAVGHVSSVRAHSHSLSPRSRRSSHSRPHKTLKGEPFPLVTGFWPHLSQRGGSPVQIPSAPQIAHLVNAGVGWRLWTNNRGKTDRGVTWARPRDLKPLLVRQPQPGRLTLGTVDKLVATEQPHSVAVIGLAGTGKTTGSAIPALLEWDGPVVATSVKGDLVEHAIGERKGAGEVWVYDPTGSTGDPSADGTPLPWVSQWPFPSVPQEPGVANASPNRSLQYTWDRRNLGGLA
jgi:hypothetical protein